jgi:DNA modification methylase
MTRAIFKRPQPEREAATICYVPVHLLRPNPKNARTHSKRQIGLIKLSIEKFGQIKPVIVDDQNIILAGHGFVEAAKLAGLCEVSVLRFSHLTNAQKRAYLLADNKIAEQAGWDREILAIELGELAELLPLEGFDVTLTGFETAEIDLLLADMDEAKVREEDILPPVLQHPITRRGELWLLDKHRLFCGDAQQAESFERLMDGALAAAAFCDPPYNLRASDIGGRGRVKHADFAFGSGEMTPARFRDFLARTLGYGIEFSTSDAVHFVCMDWRHIADLIEVGNELYDAMLNLVVWNKSNAGQGSFYRSQHELIGVFRTGQDPHQNNVELGRFGRNRSNVWTYAGINTFGRDRMKTLASHPTVKPVALVADALLDCTNRGDIILDQFAGSGTIFAAADKVGRIAYAMEYEPRYVDVAVQRWQALTKREATLAGDGRTYQEIAETRTDSSVRPQSNSLDIAEKACRSVGGPTNPAGARKARTGARSGYA